MKNTGVVDSMGTHKNKRRIPHTAWKPGQSGNPGGRPKVVAEIRDLARAHGVAAIERLAALLKSSNESVALRAAEALLDRGYGRAVQGASMDSEPIPHRVVVEFVEPKRASEQTESTPPDLPPEN